MMPHPPASSKGSKGSGQQGKDEGTRTLNIVVVGTEGQYIPMRSIERATHLHSSCCLCRGYRRRVRHSIDPPQTACNSGAPGMGPGKSTLIGRFLTGKYAAPLPPPTTAASVRVRAPYIIKGYVVTRAFQVTAPKAPISRSTSHSFHAFRAGRLSVQFTELPSGRHALAAAAPAHLQTADAVVYIYDCTNRKYVFCSH